MDREFDGKTALHHAAFAGHTDVIKTLLEFGADKDITVSIQITDVAFYSLHVNHSVQDSNGLTALHFCAFRYMMYVCIKFVICAYVRCTCVSCYKNIHVHVYTLQG